MNSNFSDNQFEAYAAAFEEGDAIWCDGEWREVVENKRNDSSKLTACADGNIFVINNGQGGGCYSGSHYGFEEEGLNKNPYRVTTLEDYELQGGERLVWLGESGYYRTFGKSYETFNDSEGNVTYRSDRGEVASKVVLSEWGVIPRYEQVQPTAQKEVEVSDIVNTLYKRYYAGIQNMLRDDIQNSLTDGDYREVIELSKMMIEMEEQR